jgi:hypothetical protein
MDSKFSESRECFAKSCFATALCKDANLIFANESLRTMKSTLALQKLQTPSNNTIGCSTLISASCEMLIQSTFFTAGLLGSISLAVSRVFHKDDLRVMEDAYAQVVILLGDMLDDQFI